MTPELTALALAALLQALQISLYALVASRQTGLKYALGPRDTPRQITGLAGRVQRAMNNHFEGLILFSITVLAVSLSGASSAFTAACAWAYLGARVLYLPAYMLGLSPVRTAIWTVGFAATLLMILAVLV